jgi:hypothetical protein
MWLTGVFGADLIVMETFGSDGAPPDIAAVSRVRDCDLFIGIYGFRYGTVDAGTGKSVTELELEEADRCYSAGSLRDMLLYRIRSDAPWLNEFREDGATATAGLTRLAEKVSKHTWSAVSKADELIFVVSRDVYRRVVAYLQHAPRALRPAQLPALQQIQEPLGMEFIHSSQRNLLVGRHEKIAELVELTNDKSIVLLIGDSGVGKTSIIHAGLLPEAEKRNWRSIYTRPFGLPGADICRQISSTIFVGSSERQSSLVATVTEVLSALGDQTVLLIIDQFEDILAARDVTETRGLLAALSQLRSLALPTLRLVISYRADLEGRLGEYWQSVSGSPSGLPRVYITGIDQDKAWAGVKVAADALSIRLNLKEPESQRVSSDLLAVSKALGFPDIYPPYLQMFVSVWPRPLE